METGLDENVAVGSAGQNATITTYGGSFHGLTVVRNTTVLLKQLFIQRGSEPTDTPERTLAPLQG